MLAMVGPDDVSIGIGAELEQAPRTPSGPPPANTADPGAAPAVEPDWLGDPLRFRMVVNGRNRLLLPAGAGAASGRSSGNGLAVDVPGPLLAGAFPCALS